MLGDASQIFGHLLRLDLSSGPPWPLQMWNTSTLTWDTVGAATYALPVATASVLGGVKQGSNVSIDGSGVISVAAPYSLPTASSSVLGGVKVGTGLSITSGVLSRDALVSADIPNLDASKITAGALALARGGTALDTSGVTNGQILIGQTSDHTFGLATLTAGSNITITNSGHSITIAASSGAVTNPAVLVHNSSTININTSTDTRPTFDTNDYDQGTVTAQHSTGTNPSRLTCQSAGIYRITAYITWSSNTTGNTRTAKFYLNNTTLIREDVAAPGSASVSGLSRKLEFDITLAVNDYVELELRQDSGSTMSMNGNAFFQPYFGWFKIG